MAINIILGDSGTGKTEFLKSKVKEYVQNNDKVVCNFDTNHRTTAIDDSKIKYLNEIEYIPEFGTYKELSEIKQHAYRYYMGLIVSEGNILLLDEPYRYLNNDQVNDMYYTLDELRNMWKEIYISGYYEDGFLTFKDYKDTRVLKFNSYNNYTVYPGKDMEDVILSV